MGVPKVAFVTGKLAEPALRQVVGDLARAGKVEPLIVVLNIQVAALMTADWLGRKLELPEGAGVERVVIPGYCRGDLGPIAEKLGVPVEAGPRDLQDLPVMFGGKRRGVSPEELAGYDVEILAEINHAARLPLEVIIGMAEAYRRDGANVIDLGCDPQTDRPAWSGVGAVVKELVGRGFAVSIDSFHPEEVEAGLAAGASIVLSVNSTNAHLAKDWRVGGDVAKRPEVVAIPDTPTDEESLMRTVEILERDGVPMRLDPIIEPLGLGFSESLVRYARVRKRYPNTAIMMGIGNITEMTEADSAGMNLLLIGFCQEQAITSVLTTQVINFARNSVKEIDIARRLMKYACDKQTPPKHIDSRLAVFRESRLRGFTGQQLADLKAGLTDKNVRIFVERLEAQGLSSEEIMGVIHVMSKDFYVKGTDPFVMFDEMGITDASHAFYLGYEMAKATLAIQLGKNYTQDVALRWGYLTKEEISHHERRKKVIRDKS